MHSRHYVTRNLKGKETQGNNNFEISNPKLSAIVFEVDLLYSRYLEFKVFKIRVT